LDRLTELSPEAILSILESLGGQATYWQVRDSLKLNEYEFMHDELVFNLEELVKSGKLNIMNQASKIETIYEVNKK
jgi:hypothetical protein